jgi:hypothetical protein
VADCNLEIKNRIGARLDFEAVYCRNVFGILPKLVRVALGAKEQKINRSPPSALAMISSEFAEFAHRLFG